jgi:lipopolysaccharide exporter
MSFIQRFRSVMPERGFLRGALTIALGTGAGQLIVVVSSPILTRLYGPSDFGVYAVATSIMAVLISVICLRYEVVIPLPESDAVAADVLALCLLVTLVLAAAAAVVLGVAGSALLTLVGAGPLSPYSALLALGVFGGGVVAAFTGWAVRTKSYSEIAANRVTQSGTLVAAQLSLGILGLGPFGLLVGVVAGSVAGSSRLAWVAWKSHATSFKRVSRTGMLSAATRYKRFPILSGPSALLNTFGLELPVLLVVAFFGAAVGGQYALAQRVIALPATLIGGAIAQVYFAEGARRAQQRPEELRGLFLRTSRSLALTGLGPFALVALAAPFLFGPVFGANWREAGLYVAILAPMFYLQFVASPTGATLDILERQDLHLSREIVRVSLLVGAVFLSSALHLTPVGVIGALSLAGCLTYALYGVTSWRAIAAHHADAHRGRSAGANGVTDLPTTRDE